MVEDQLRSRDIKSEVVLAAMRTVPRHRFVPEELRHRAHEDSALSLGPQQSISQPYMVALMTELAAPLPGERVLEVGTGSGYQAAVLAEMAGEVYTIEIDANLASRAAAVLSRLHYRNVRTRCGDGRAGWPEAAPFGVIVVTACTTTVPTRLFDQLASNGRLIIPSGTAEKAQVLKVLVKGADGDVSERDVMPVRFVPLA